MNLNINNRDYYSCAPGSLVVLSFPHAPNLCSLFPTSLVETLTNAQSGAVLVVNSDEWGHFGLCFFRGTLDSIVCRHVALLVGP